MPGALLHFRLLFAVNDAEKAGRRLREVARAIGPDAEGVVVGRYWKDGRLWEATIGVAGIVGSPAEVAFECLIRAARLGHGWIISGPGGDGRLDGFAGVLDTGGPGRSAILGLEWASFALILAQ